jgi:glycosyltransferase involved in cell wall biosynthesis
MSTPLISVLMTAYNREKYIAEAIESVLASSFKDFELIIVDDGSKDRTVEIARRYTLDPRVRVHVNEKNLGDYPNRNRAASLAQGRYLKYVDSDDVVYPHCLETMVRMMERFPDSGLGLAAFAQDPARPFPIRLSPREAYFRHYFRTSVFDPGPLAAIIRKDAFEAVGGFTGKRMVGDFELWHIVAARYPVVMMPYGLVWYRKHAEQEMQDYRTDPQFAFTALAIACEQLRKPECPLSAEERLVALRQMRRRLARLVLRTLASHQCARGADLFRRSGRSLVELFFDAFRSVRPGRVPNPV